MISGGSLPAEPSAPRLAVLPLLPTRDSKQFTCGTVELPPIVRVRPCPSRHAGQRRANRVGERDAFVHRLQELELRAVEVSNDNTCGPAAAHSVVLRRQVVQVEDVGLRRPSGSKRWLPDR